MFPVFNMVESAFEEQGILSKLDDCSKLAHDQWFKEVDNFTISDRKGTMRNISELIKQNKSLQSTVDRLLKREEARDKSLSAIEKHLEALASRSFDLPDFSSVSDSSAAEESITIDNVSLSTSIASSSASAK